MAKNTNASLRILFGADSTELQAALVDVQAKMKKFGRNMQKTGKSLTRNLTAPLAGIAAAATKTAVDFEFAMAKVAAVSGFTAGEMNALEKSAREFGEVTAFSASEVAALQLELAKLGMDPRQIQDMTDGVLSLAQAFDLSLADSAERVALNLKRFNLASNQSTRVADVMAKAFGSTALDSEKLEEALKMVGPTANSLGFTLEETTAILGAMANQGIAGSMAGTSLTKTLTTLAKEGGDVKENFKALTFGTSTVAENFNRFGDRAGKVVPVLQAAGDEIAALTDGLNNAGGAAKSAREKLDNTAQGALKRMTSALESAAIELGNKLLPLLESFVNRITSLAQGFARMDPHLQGFIIVIGGIAAAIGPLLILIGQMSIGLAALVPVLATVAGALAPVIAFLSAFAVPLALAAATIYLFNKALKKKKEKLNEVVAAQKAANAAANEHVKTLEKESGALTDEQLAERVALLKEERQELGAMESVVSDRVAGLARTSEIEAHILAQSKQKINLDQEGNRVIEDTTKETQRLVEVDAELSALTAELTRRTEAANEAKRKSAERRKAEAKAAREQAEALKKLRLERDMETGEALGLAPEDFNIGGLLTVLGEGTAKVNEFAMSMQAPFMAAADNIAAAEQTASDAFESIEDKAQRLERIGLAIGNSFGAGMAQIVTGAGEAKNAVAKMVGTMVTGALRASQANIIAAMTAAGIVTGPAAPVVIPALVASGIALVEGLFAALPALKDGGITMGPQLALIGDNPSGKEAVIPFERMGQFLQMVGGGQGASVVTGRLQGMDLLLSSQKATLARNRNT